MNNESKANTKRLKELKHVSQRVKNLQETLETYC